MNKKNFVFSALDVVLLTLVAVCILSTVFQKQIHRFLGQEEMDAVPVDLVDYVGCGPVYPTATKLDAAADMGLQSWAAVAASSPLPVVAIGGIDTERARAIRATGVAAGVAVVSAICAAADPQQAARELL